MRSCSLAYVHDLAQVNYKNSPKKAQDGAHVFNHPGDLSLANLEDPEQRLFSELLCAVRVATDISIALF